MKDWRILYLLSNEWSYDAIALWPFVIVKKRYQQQGVPHKLLQHEMIHLKQQTELLIIPFYFFYLLEWLLKLMSYRNWTKAYKSISFEQEAYRYECTPTYLKNRPPFAFLKFIGK